MATKRFIIEVEEENTKCDNSCPHKVNGNCIDLNCSMENVWDIFNCDKYNLSTMKIKEYDDTNEGKALLYAVEKTAERTKREMNEKAIEWMRNNLHNFATNVSYKSLFDEFQKAMQDESKRLD